jgi:hypothetical protein
MIHSMGLYPTMDAELCLVLVESMSVNLALPLESPDRRDYVLIFWDIPLFPNLPMTSESVIVGNLYHGSLELSSIVYSYHLLIVQGIGIRPVGSGGDWVLSLLLDCIGFFLCIKVIKDGVLDLL